MDVKRFIEKTLEDTIGFLQVHVRMLKALKDQEESEEKAAGIQAAIDLLESSCDTGSQVAEAYIGKRREILQKMMQNEAEEALHPAVESCGEMEIDKKLN